MKRIALIATLLSFAFTASGCSPEVGTPEWCKAMKEKAKGDWTATEAKAYAKHCLF